MKYYPCVNFTRSQCHAGSYFPFRWTVSIDDLLRDDAGKEEFRRFLEKEVSAENLEYVLNCITLFVFMIDHTRPITKPRTEHVLTTDQQLQFYHQFYHKKYATISNRVSWIFLASLSSRH